MYSRTKDSREVYSSCILPICYLCDGKVTNVEEISNLFKPSNFLNSLRPPTTKAASLVDVSLLELCLLVCVSRLEVFSDQSSANFLMAYDEYQAQVKHSASMEAASVGSVSSGSLRLFKKRVCLAAWERLIERGLLVPESTNNLTATGQEYAKFCSEISLTDLDRVLQHPVRGSRKDDGIPISVMRWLKEIQRES